MLWVAIGDVEDGGRWIDMLVVVPKVDIDGSNCLVE